MLNGHYNGEVRSYLLALQDGNKPDRPEIPPYWRDAVEKAEGSYARSDGDAEVVRRTLSTLCKLNTEPYCNLAELLATERPPLALARVDGDDLPAPDAMGTELQDALLAAKDVARIQEHISEIAAWDEVTFTRFKMKLKALWPTFPMREFLDWLRAEKRQLEQQSRRQPVVKSAYDLMQISFPEKEWIVPDILPMGLITLAGKQKIGKSWLDYNLCLAVGSGGMAFGSKPVQQGDVLYLALEDNEQRLQDRFKQLLGPGEVMPSRIDYATEWPRMDADGVAALESWIQSKPNPRLIIIDPWVKVRPRVKARQGETGYDADYEAMEGVKRLADTYNICILVQFHIRKASAEDPMDELNGTSGVTACADGSLFLKRARGESDATLWGTGREYKEDVDLALKFDSGYWNILGDAKAYTLTKESKEIIDTLNQSGIPMQPKEIAMLLRKPAALVRNRLFEMKNRNEVEDTGSGYLSLISKDAYHSNASNVSNASNGTDGGMHWNASGNPPTPIELDGKPPDESLFGSVGAITPSSESLESSEALEAFTQLREEALVLLSEVRTLFKERAGIPQFWRDDINPMRKIEQPDWIAKATEAISSGDPQRIQLAITAMKWTTRRLYPGREKEEASPLQG